MATEEMQLFLHNAVVHVIRRFVPFRNHITVRGSIVIDADNCKVRSIGFDDVITPSSLQSNCETDVQCDASKSTANIFLSGLFDSTRNETNVKNDYLKYCNKNVHNGEDYSGDLDDEIIRIIGATGLDKHRILTKGQERKRFNATGRHVTKELSCENTERISFNSNSCESSSHANTSHADARRLWGGFSKSNANKLPGDCSKIKISPDSVRMKSSSIANCERSILDVSNLMSRVITVKPLHRLRRLVGDNDDNDEILNDNLESIDRREEEEEEEDSVEYKRLSRLPKKRRTMSSHLSRIIKSCDSETSFDSDASRDMDLKHCDKPRENACETHSVINGVHFRRSAGIPEAHRVDCYREQRSTKISPVLLRNLDTNISSGISLGMDSLSPVTSSSTSPRMTEIISLAAASLGSSLATIWTPNSCTHDVSTSTSQQILRDSSPYSIFTLVSAAQISKTVSPIWISPGLSVQANTTTSPLKSLTRPTVSQVVMSTIGSVQQLSPAVSSANLTVSPTILTQSPVILSTDISSTTATSASLSSEQSISSSSQSFELSPLSVAVALTSTISNSRLASHAGTVSSILHTDGFDNRCDASIVKSEMPVANTKIESCKVKNIKFPADRAYSKTEHRLNYKAHRRVTSKMCASSETSKYCDDNDIQTRKVMNHLNSRSIDETHKRPTVNHEETVRNGHVVRLRPLVTTDVDITLDVVNVEWEGSPDAKNETESRLVLPSLIASSSKDKDKMDRSPKRRSDVLSDPGLAENHQHPRSSLDNDIRRVETLSPSIDERMKKYPCDFCDASFTMSNNLRRHIRKSHRTSERKIQTDARHFDQARRSPVDPLRVAMIPWDLLLVHDRPPPVVRLVIPSPPLHPDHTPPILRTPSMSRRGNGRYRHVCNVCSASFTFRTNLTRHAKKTHGSVPLESDMS